jgi:hypothetical protein
MAEIVEVSPDVVVALLVTPRTSSLALYAHPYRGPTTNRLSECVASVHARDGSHDGQAQTMVQVTARATRFNLVEAIEDERKLLFWNPGAAIRYGQ